MKMRSASKPPRVPVSLLAATLLAAAAIVVGCNELTAPSADPALRQIAYSVIGSEGRYDLFLVGPVAAEPLVTTAGNKLDPSWSPDGATLAFRVTGSSGAAISLVNADGSNARPVSMAGAAGPPSWSPDGQWLVFPVSGGTQRVTIDAVRPDGTGRHTITAADSIVYETVSWSKTGRIAFVRTPAAGDDRSIWSVGADGSGLVQITAGPMDEAPRWSPDGSMLAFSAGTTDFRTSDAMLTTADGTGVQTVTGSETNVFNHVEAWSPDGDWLLVRRSGSIIPGGSGTALYRLPLLGGYAVRVTPLAAGQPFAGATWR